MRPAVEIEKDGKTLVLAYRPRDDDEWVQRKFERGEELTIKGTYHLTKADLLAGNGKKADEDLWEETPLRFRLGRLREEYYVVEDGVLDIGTPVWLHKDCNPTWKWFSAERRVSVLGVIAQLRPTRIVIGGPQPDAIPVQEYERLLRRFPTPHELRRYSLARVAAVVREYLDTDVDAERAYQKYVNKLLQAPASDLTEPFRDIDAKKFQLLHQRLQKMLDAEETYAEARWQAEILQIIRLLNPRYIHSIEKVRIPDLDAGTTREIDIMLVDASGNIDLIEIKKPFDKSIVSSGTYRDNHIPLRELSGSIMQIEKYIYYLNRWGERGEQEMTRRFADKLPEGFQVRITNPSGIVIIGRDRDLTPSQRRDFEIVKRKYKNIVDILTYDDLLRRIGFVLQQLSAGT
jgi:hypothetical protein